MNIGNKIKERRLQLGMTQQELAESMRMQGIDKCAISRYENDKANPAFKTLAKLCESLSVEIVLKPFKK